MKQAVQNIRSGRTDILDVPAPRPGRGMVLVRTVASVVSVGTERSVVEFAGKSLVGKARSRPDLVRQVVDKVRREGLWATFQATTARLDQPMALGYSSAGVVAALGEGVSSFHVGDRVACAGGGHAVHAEYAAVPVNLLAKVPAGVPLEEAAFATLGAIALHGFRLSGAVLGENVAVIGLGLLGQMAAQIARAAGCRVFGIDLDPARIRLAGRLGAHEASPRAAAERRAAVFTGGRGFDAVLICADTPSNDPVELAGAIARDKGRVVAVGLVGTGLPRRSYYDRELEFIVSRSYGPGRYDSAYEEAGHDYPYGHVRWTENRNLSAFLDLLKSGDVRTDPLITHRFPIERAAQAYKLISAKGRGKAPFLGVVLTYAEDSNPRTAVELTPRTKPSSAAPGIVRLGVLGAGNFATAVALPAIARLPGVERVSVVSGAGLTARIAAGRFGFLRAGSDPADVLDDPAIDAVGIFTRHGLHAAQSAAALRAGKHVFCEKPLALDEAGLRKVEEAAKAAPERILMAGYNRRFAPMVMRLRDQILSMGEPPVLTVRVNGGALPAQHWLRDPQLGGGRVLGEACHFVDLLAYLAGAMPVRVAAANALSGGVNGEDNFSATFEFGNGAVGSLVYVSSGERVSGKERIEAYFAGCTATVEDYYRQDLWRHGARRSWTSSFGQDKGHRAAWEAFVCAIREGRPSPIPPAELFAVTRATFELLSAIREGGWAPVGESSRR